MSYKLLIYIFIAKYLGPVSLPFFGSALQIALYNKKRNYEIFEDMALKYGPIFGFRAGLNHFGKNHLQSINTEVQNKMALQIIQRTSNKIIN